MQCKRTLIVVRAVWAKWGSLHYITVGPILELSITISVVRTGHILQALYLILVP